MPELKFLITADDEQAKKKLAEFRKFAADSNKSVAEITDRAVKGEENQRKEVLKVINAQTDAIKKRNVEESKAPTKSGPLFDPAADIAAAQKTSNFSYKEPATTSKQELINQFKNLGVQQQLTESYFNNGKISADKYAETIDRLSKKQGELRAAIQGYGQAQTTTSTTTEKATDGVKKQLSIFEKLTQELKTYKEQKFAITPASLDKLPIVNNRIAELRDQLSKLNNVGKTGFDDLGNAIDKPVGKLERLKYAAQEFQKFSASSNNPDIIEKYNKKLQDTQLEIGRVGNVGKAGFDELGNKIQGSTGLVGKLWNGIKLIANVLPGVGYATVLAFAVGPLIDYLKTLDLFKDKISQATANFDALNEVQGEVNKQVGSQISNLKILYQTTTDVKNSEKDRVAAAQELKKEYPDAFANSSLMSILNGKEKDSYDLLTGAILDQAKARAAVSKIGEIEAKKQDAEFQKQKIDAARTNQLADYAVFQKQNAINYKNGSSFLAPGSIQDRANVQKIKDDAAEAYKAQDDQIKLLSGQEAFLTKYAGGGKKLAEVIEGNTNLIKEPLKNFDSLVKNITSKADVDNIEAALRAKMAALGPNDKQIAVYQDKLRQLELIDKKYSPKAGDGVSSENQYQSALAKRTDVISKIAAAQAEASAKSKTQDQQELDANDQKFVALRASLIAYNTWAQNYNKSHTQKIGLVDVAQIEPIRKTETDNILAKQQLEKDKVQYDQQKQIFDKYEEYKLKVGDENADKLYGDQLKGFKSYVEYLQSLQPASSDTSAYANATRDYLNKELPVAYKEAESKQAESLQALLIQTMGFEQQAQALVKKFIEGSIQLRQQGYDKQAEILEKQGELELDALLKNNKQKLDSYKDLSNQLEGLSYEEAEFRIEQAKKALQVDLATGAITEEQYKKSADYLKQAQSAVKSNGIESDLSNVATFFTELADSTDGLDKKISNTFKNISSAFSQAASLKDNINKLQTGIANFSQTKSDNGGGFLGTVAGVTKLLPIVGSVISGTVKAVGAVVGFFKAAGKTARDSAAQIVAYNQSMLASGITYNELLRDRLRTQGDISKMTSDELKLREQMLGTQKSQAQEDYKKLLALIQSSGQQIAGEHTEKYGGFLGIAKKTKVVQDLAGLSSADYESLEKLYTQGKLTDSTKTWFEELKKVHDELDTIGVSSQEAADQLANVTTGTTAGAIADGILEGFKQGKRTIADFGDDLTAMFQNASYSMFKNNILDAKIAEFYKQFAAAAEDGGLTDDKIAQLKAAYASVIDSTAKQFDDLEKVVGAPAANSSSTNSVKGGIEAMTEQTGELIAGQFGGFRLAQLTTNTLIEAGNLTLAQQKEISMQGIYSLQEISANTFRTADNTERLANVEKALNDINKKMDNNYNSLAATGRL